MENIQNDVKYENVMILHNIKEFETNRFYNKLEYIGLALDKKTPCKKIVPMTYVPLQFEESWDISKQLVEKDSPFIPISEDFKAIRPASYHDW